MANEYVIAAVAAALAGFGAAAVAGSGVEHREMVERTPQLMEADALRGRWRLEAQEGGCTLVLGLGAVDFEGPNAPAWRLRDEGGCLSGLGLDVVQAWRPSSDGMALLRADGSLVAFLSRKGQTFEGQGPGGERLRLVRP